MTREEVKKVIETAAAEGRIVKPSKEWLDGVNHGMMYCASMVETLGRKMTVGGREYYIIEADYIDNPPKFEEVEA